METGDEMDDLVIKGTSIGWSWEQIEKDDTILGCFLIHTMMSWKLYMDENVDKSNEEKRREHGKITHALSGIQNDIHNLSIVINMLNELVDKLKLQSNDYNQHLLTLHASVLLETYFTNLRSIYDFCSTFIRIIVSDKYLKSMPASDSYNSLLKFIKKKTVVGVLPSIVIEILKDNEQVFETVKIVRDLIIHKGEENLVNLNSDGTLCFTLYKNKQGTIINMAPDILNTNQTEYPIMKYLSVLTIRVMNFLDLFGRALFHFFEEIQGFQLPLWLTGLGGYCMTGFIAFLNEHA